MRIDLHDQARRHVMWVKVDPRSPARVVQGRGPHGRVQEQYLEWDRAFDDEGNLRRCPVCGCEDLYRRSTAPPLTGFLMLLVVGLICLLLWGVSDAPVGLLVGVLVALSIGNIVIMVLARQYSACYRCESRFFDVGIPRGRGEWQAAIAERHRPRPAAAKPRVAEESVPPAGDAARPAAHRGDLA